MRCIGINYLEDVSSTVQNEEIRKKLRYRILSIQLKDFTIDKPASLLLYFTKYLAIEYVYSHCIYSELSNNNGDA